MPLYAKTCESCHQEHTAVRRNQKLCRPCRLLRDLDYWNEASTKTSKCRVCQAAFWKTNRNTDACSKCQPGGSYGDCLVCLNSNRDLERPSTPICRGCARHSDPAVRRLCRTELREHLGLHTAPAEHPAIARVRGLAKMAADRLGCTEAKAIVLAKLSLDLDPDAPTEDLDALYGALEQL